MTIFSSIQPFIDLGWYTVPLRGEIKRLENGNKTVPIFEKDWSAKYREVRNTQASAIGSVLTGPSSIIAIDCDNDATSKIFTALDPGYRFVFVSAGRAGVTIIYSLPSDAAHLLTSFKLVRDDIKLDFFSDSGAAYLPTKDNTSKVLWSEMPELTAPPTTVITLLGMMRGYSLAGNRAVLPSGSASRNYSFSLAPMVRVFVSRKRFTPGLFRVLTPKDFRSLPQYVEAGFLHPRDVPDGRGSEYLSKISAILGSDKSVDEELYANAMYFINSLWSKPMSRGHLDSTIVTPMLDKTASVGGKALWQYDDSWESGRYFLETKKDETIETFYDDNTDIYYIVNQDTGHFRPYKRVGDCFGVLDVVSSTTVKKRDFIDKLPLVNTCVQPEKAPGMCVVETEHGPREMFNLFNQSRALNIVNSPEQYTELYRRPDHILRFLSSLIPDAGVREYAVRFLKTKLTTFNYSPVVLYFLGVSGSGKDTFVELINKIMGETLGYVAKPSAKSFVENHNGWLRGVFFAHLDEYGDQLNSFSARQEATGKLKTYTGSSHVQLREMHGDGRPHTHAITFILTANKNPLAVDHDDRRLVVIDTPTVLKNESWVQDVGGMSAARTKMWEELHSFCYYLAIEVKALSVDEYTTPPENRDKLHLIANLLNSADRVVFCLCNELVDVIQDMVDIAGVNPFNRNYHNSNTSNTDGIYMSVLYDFLYAYDPENITKKMLSRALKKYGVEKTPTTREGVKEYFCHFNIPEKLSSVDIVEISLPAL